MMRLAAKFEFLMTLKPRFSTVRFSSQLFVSRLSFYTTNEEFQRMFSPFGEVKEAKLVMDPATKRPKGFGFVTFETEAEAQDAVRGLNGRIVQGRVVFVEFAKNTKDK